MSFHCADCGWVTESRDRTAIEIHKLTHVIIGMTTSLSNSGLLPKQPKVNTSNM